MTTAIIKLFQQLLDLQERQNWQLFSKQGLNKAYSDDEPDYFLHHKNF